MERSALVVSGMPGCNDGQPDPDTVLCGLIDVLGPIDGGDRGDVHLAVARAVALAHALPGLRESGRCGADQLHAMLTGPCSRLDAAHFPKLAVILADADTMSRLVRARVTADVQERATTRVREAIGSLPPGRLSPGVAERAIAAAGGLARIRFFADALTSPEHATAVSEWLATLRALPTTPRVPAVSTVLDDEAARRARSAAIVRTVVGALQDCLPHLDAGIQALAGQLRRYPGHAVDNTGQDQLRERVMSKSRAREVRAAKLVEQLHAMAAPGTTGVPAVLPTDRELLAWLRRVTHEGLYTKEFEDQLAGWLDADPFRLRVLPPPPEFLAGFDFTDLRPEHVAPFLRRMCLTRPTPTAADLTPEALDADKGRTSAVDRTSEQRRWSQPADSLAPSLPKRGAIPWIVHGMWLGKPMPATTRFWQNYGQAARHYAEQVNFVLWTDVPRARFTAALAEPAPPQGQPDPLADVRALLNWSRECGILIANVFEIFHAQAPMVSYAQYVLEMSKQLPRGFTAASDHLRVELIHRFGGGYMDGDVTFIAPQDQPELESLPDFFERVAGSRHGFTLNPVPRVGVGNDAFAGPARHPAFRLWLEVERLNYFQTQRQIFGGIKEMAEKFVGEQRQAMRYIAPSRTGRMHHTMLEYVGINPEDLPQTKGTLLVGNELTWVAPRSGEPTVAVPHTEDSVLTALAKTLTFLRWQLITREGDLYLCAADPVIRGLPDPDAAWIAVLIMLPELGPGVPAVTSVTDLRRNDDTTIEQVNLPPEAEILLDRLANSPQWLGAEVTSDGRSAWLLDEQVSQAALRTRTDLVRDYLDAYTPYAEITVDPCGHPLGIWLRSPGTADLWRDDDRFEAVPPGHIGISIGRARFDGRDLELEFHPEDIALILSELGATNRPVVLMTDERQAVGPFGAGFRQLVDSFASSLSEFLNQPVIQAPLSPRKRPTLNRPIVPLVEHLPFAAFRRS